MSTPIDLSELCADCGYQRGLHNSTALEACPLDYMGSRFHCTQGFRPASHPVAPHPAEATLPTPATTAQHFAKLAKDRSDLLFRINVASNFKGERTDLDGLVSHIIAQYAELTTLRARRASLEREAETLRAELRIKGES